MEVVKSLRTSKPKVPGITDQWTKHLSKFVGIGPHGETFM